MVKDKIILLKNTVLGKKMVKSGMGSSASPKYISRTVRIGTLELGGDNPIRIQSMANTSTMDTRATVSQCIELFDCGSELVRVTVPGKREALNLRDIKNQLLEKGYKQPLVADVHFLPAAAEIAAATVEKVRINPGNYGEVRSRSAFNEAEYKQSLKLAGERLKRLAEICSLNKTVLRIGVNHGSLSPRILYRYGNTVEGMVESAMEYLRILKRLQFQDIVVSLKSSDALTMINANRLAVVKMKQEGMDYPLHLGVTEAGEGEDGRIRSALGIGVLLEEGMGDTIRVSLTEDPVKEIPFARKLAQRYPAGHEQVAERETGGEDFRAGAGQNTPFEKESSMGLVFPVVIGERVEERGSIPGPDLVPGGENKLSTATGVPRTFTYSEDVSDLKGKDLAVITSPFPRALCELRSKIRDVRKQHPNMPVILKKAPKHIDPEEFLIEAVIDLGGILVEGGGDGIWLESPVEKAKAVELAYGILQATGRRVTKAEFIACPSCGRTKFDIQSVLARVKQETSHLKGLKIAVMGCIVNGPGEMAGADYGYVGSGSGIVTLFRGPEVIRKNIPEENAIGELLELIRQDRRWVDP